MHWIDWTIVVTMAVFMTALAAWTRRYMRSVADFLAASRCAGPYILCLATGMVQFGAVSIMAFFEMYYSAGFAAKWWQFMAAPVGLIVTLTGWIIYRYRQTRAMTMAQFFEIRYSRNFRIFAGILAWTCGVINFGIFPAVGARFFLYFCGLPETLEILGIPVSTFVAIMIALIALSLFFTFSGGQVAVIVTDFFQGMFCNVVFALLTLVVLLKIDWTTIVAGLAAAPKDASLLHPFHSHAVRDFNVWYFLIAAFSMFYSHMSWQGAQAFNCSAKSPHHAKMAGILGGLRQITLITSILVLPVVAYAVMHHPALAGVAAKVNGALAPIANPEVQKQLTVPLVLRHILPVGLIGLFCAAMLAAFISTHDTALHSWGSIFIQDVVLPFRRERLTARQHLWLLRGSICGVAVFIFAFSLLFRQTSHLLMFFAITGAIYLGGSGSVIIGGLYWKRGTTAGAWASMITGSTLAVAGIVVKQADPGFPLNEQVMFFLAMIASISVYVLVSLLGPRQDFNLDRMLHRGPYRSADDPPIASARGFKALGITSEFSRGDKLIYFAVLAWTLMWWAIFLVGTIYSLWFDTRTESWAAFWHCMVWVYVSVAIGTTVWITIGGLRDMKDMFAILRTAQPNELDDGTAVSLNNP